MGYGAEQKDKKNKNKRRNKKRHNKKRRWGNCILILHKY